MTQLLGFGRLLDRGCLGICTNFRWVGAFGQFPALIFWDRAAFNLTIHITNTILPLLQETFLGDDLILELAGSTDMSLHPTPLSSFPCFADEMEEQAKSIEFDL